MATGSLLRAGSSHGRVRREPDGAPASDGVGDDRPDVLRHDGDQEGGVEVGQPDTRRRPKVRQSTSMGESILSCSTSCPD